MKNKEFPPVFLTVLEAHKWLSEQGVSEEDRKGYRFIVPLDNGFNNQVVSNGCFAHFQKHANKPELPICGIFNSNFILSALVKELEMMGADKEQIALAMSGYAAKYASFVKYQETV